MSDAASDVEAGAEADLEVDDELDDVALDDVALDDDNDEDDDDDDLEDEVDGNRVVGGLSAGVLDYLARSIVDDEDAVDIEVDEGRRSVMLRLHVSPSDMGRVIGRRGRVAQAIRTVVRAAGARENVEASVDIVD
ncbi:MAG: uncharacterized protein QOG82_2713 [Actinomycetota bacterium]|nr:uncharacterized protein [Actinomycetota bacterium]